MIINYVYKEQLYYFLLNYKYRIMSLAERIQDLSNISSALGILMKSGQNSYSPIRLALQPYLIKRQNYELIGEISKVWQKLFYLASKDIQLIKKTFEQVSQVDDLIRNIYQIFLKTCTIPRNDSLLITRVDYFKNNNQEFKIIEYNITATSMHSHSQKFLKAHQTLDFAQQRNLQNKYPQNTPCTDLANAVAELYQAKKLNGLFLLIVTSNEKNVIDQSTIQLKLLEKGIKSKRQGLCKLSCKIKKKQNKLFYQNQQISVVYFRAGYQPKDYCQTGDIQSCWKARQIIELSDAIKIPDVKMELMNQKRMQVQLSKQHVYSKYLNQEQCNLLRKSLVYTVDFQQNNADIDYVKFIQENGIDKYILKPNLEGGGNNIYGRKAYQLLKTISKQQRKKYILMQKIYTKSVQNTMFLGAQQYKTLNCICEVSRYGILLEIDGKLVRNNSNGYLVRIKPQNADEGGVMAGVGSIAAIAFQN